MTQGYIHISEYHDNEKRCSEYGAHEKSYTLRRIVHARETEDIDKIIIILKRGPNVC